MKEIWKPIVGFPGYEVSNRGRVGSFKKREGASWIITNTLQLILSHTLISGYRAVHPCHEGTPSTRRIGGLVLEAFVGPRPKGMEVCHMDCNKQNDYLDNLRWDTHTANLADGYGSTTTRLTKQGAKQVRSLAAKGSSDEQLAKQFSVSKKTIARCRTGRSYAYAEGPITLHNLTDAQVREIRQLAHMGTNYATITKVYNVSISGASRIARGITRRKAGGPISPRRRKHNIRKANP